MDAQPHNNTPLHNFFLGLLNSVDGIMSVAVTDREGAPSLIVHNNEVPNEILRPKFLATTCLAFEHSDRLDFGMPNHIVAYFSNYQVVCFKQGRLFVTFVAQEGSNTGSIIGLRDHFGPIVKDLSAILN